MFKKIVGVVVAVTVCIVIIMAMMPAFQIQSDNNTIDVLIIDGQSNAQYRGWNTNNICNSSILIEDWNKTPSHRVLYYGTESTPIYYKTPSDPDYDTTFASYGIHSMYDDGWLIGGYEPILAYDISERSGRDILIINVSVGAANVQFLSPSGDGGKYAQNVIDRALSEIKQSYSYINMLGVVWSQGEADKTLSVDLYKERFGNVMSMFSKYGANKFYIIEGRDYYCGNSNTAQEQIAQSNPNVMIATDTPQDWENGSQYLNGTDYIHYSQKGRTVIAEEIAPKITVGDSYGDWSMIQSIINIIPLLLIISVLLLVVGTVIINRSK